MGNAGRGCKVGNAGSGKVRGDRYAQRQEEATDLRVGVLALVLVKVQPPTGHRGIVYLFVGLCCTQTLVGAMALSRIASFIFLISAFGEALKPQGGRGGGAGVGEAAGQLRGLGNHLDGMVQIMGGDSVASWHGIAGDSFALEAAQLEKVVLEDDAEG